MKTETPNWKYCSLGGALRVKISTGADLMRLSQLDEKYWTVLSSPTADMEFDKETLAAIDSDGDGKIRVCEVVTAANWLCSALKDKDKIFQGPTELALDGFDTSTPEGARLHDSAVRILGNLGKTADKITLADASDGVAIFKDTLFNGDGIIIPASAGSDEDAAKAIEACMDTTAPATDRSGKPGITADMIEKFYADCADYDAWTAQSETEAKTIYPFGADTSAAYAAVCAIKDKMGDFFTRCRLLAYDKDTAAAVSVQAATLGDVSTLPLAHPNVEAELPLDAINPFWQGAFDALNAQVLSKSFKALKTLDEAKWKEVLAMFAPYEQWLAAKKGAAVEPLGIEAVRGLLKADKKAALLELVARDKALEQESNAIDDVKKLMLLYRDFAKFLDNYLIFTDFYSRANGGRAVFEIGKLYIDQRCCDLCLRVTDMSKHADMSALSGMFLIYCNCVSKTLGQKMDIVAVLTAGEISELRPGKNGIFYDRAGNDWDATITKVVDNPISVAQAFWSPYRKFWEFCVGLINKSATDKDSKMMAEMQQKASAAMANPPAAGTATATAAADGSGKAQAFDIAKFAGIFAALGMALGYIGSFLTKLVAGIAATPWWQLLIAIAAIMLIISGPSCFIAWSKLRKRNLGPVLNANGWAINSKVLVNIVFGSKLTSIATYPNISIYDPDKVKSGAWWKWLLAVVVLAIAAVVTLHLLDVISVGLLERIFG